MPDQGEGRDQTATDIAVGTRVLTYAEYRSTDRRTGVVVDDHADIMQRNDQFKSEFAVTKRWAVVLDNETRVVLRDTDELEPTE